LKPSDESFSCEHHATADDSSGFYSTKWKKTKNKNFFEKFVVFDIGIKLEKKLNIIGKL